MKKTTPNPLHFILIILSSISFFVTTIYFIKHSPKTYIINSQSCIIFFISFILLLSCFFFITGIACLTLIYKKDLSDCDKKEIDGIKKKSLGICMILIVSSTINIFASPFIDKLNKNDYEKALNMDILYAQTFNGGILPKFVPYFESAGLTKKEIQVVAILINKMDLESLEFTTDDIAYLKENHKVKDFHSKYDYYLEKDLICEMNHLTMEPEYCPYCGISKTTIYSLLFNDSYVCSNCKNLLDLKADFCIKCGIENDSIERLKKSLNPLDIM